MATTRYLTALAVSALVVAHAGVAEAERQPFECGDKDTIACFDYCPVNPGGGGGYYPCGLRLSPDIREPDSARNVGGGTISGTMLFAGSGIPPQGTLCEATSYTLAASGESFTFNTVIAGYVGPVAVTGSGSADCEWATQGAGSLQLEIEGAGPTGSTLQCEVGGDYTRITTDITATVAGTCLINGYATPVQAALKGQLIAEPGQGVSSPTSDARLYGALLVTPV